MNDFEKEIRLAATQHREETNARLRVPQSPLSRRGAPHWGWYATPAAAVVGVVLGMSLTALTQRTEDTLALVRNTIVRHEVVRDTVFVERLAQAQAVPSSDTLRPIVCPRRASKTPPPAPKTTPVGCSVAEDGIRYSMLMCE